MERPQEGIADNASNAPELDPNSSAPRPSSFEDGLQVRFGDDGLEPDPSTLAPQPDHVGAGLQLRFGNDGLERSRKEDSNNATEQKGKQRRRRLIVISTVICIVVIALGVGLGVGLKLTKTSRSPLSSNPTGLTPTSSSFTSIATSTATQTAALITGILDDTSLAAVMTSEGNRHVFFQDANQSLRHAVFEQSAGVWLSEAEYLNTSTLPQNHTPIAAIEIKYFQNINVFYIGADGDLAAVMFSPGGSTSLMPNAATMNASFHAVLGSRTLSISPMVYNQSQAYAEALLLYEASVGSITVLHGYFISNSTNGLDQWIWQNVTDAVYLSLAQKGIGLEPPVASSNLDYLERPIIQFCFLNSGSDPSTGVHDISRIEFDWLGLLPNASLSPSTISTFGSMNSSEILEDDIISWHFGEGDGSVGGIAWVHGDHLILQPTIPASPYPYPFGRLAWTNDTNASAMYFYRQLTNEVLAEDAYYLSAGWNTGNITVGTSP